MQEAEVDSQCLWKLGGCRRITQTPRCRNIVPMPSKHAQVGSTGNGALPLFNPTEAMPHGVFLQNSLMPACVTERSRSGQETDIIPFIKKICKSSLVKSSQQVKSGQA